MGLYIIHLTDIHINDCRDQVLLKAEALAQRCCSDIVAPADVLIIITGDMSFSGKAEQFELFHSFLNKIISPLKGVPGINSVTVFTVPGNHDCDFSKQSDIRDTLMSTIDCRNTDGFKAGCVNFITNEVLYDYFSFSKDNFTGLDANDNISKCSTLDTSVGKIAIVQFNTAWFSKRHEEAGKLCMPINLLPEIPIDGYDLIIALTHHPLSWLHPDNKIEFERILRNSVDLYLCGHEHTHDNLQQQGHAWNYLTLEGKELQAHSDSNKSSFALYRLNQTLTEIEIRHYDYAENEYTLVSSYPQVFKRNQSATIPQLYPNAQMVNELRDLGVILHHPHADNINLDDIFVWPVLEGSSIESADYYIQIEGNKVYEELRHKPLSVVSGEESSGKTALAKQLYLSAIKEGACCLMASGSIFHRTKRDSIKAEIDSIFIEQYGKNLLDQFNNQPRDKKILIIDDFEQITHKNERASFFINTLRDFFSTIILLTENQNSIPFILNKSDLGEIPFYKIRPLSHSKINELIERWYSLGNSHSVIDSHEFEALIDRVTHTISDFLGRFDSLMPATPLTILSLLQTIDATGATVAQGHSYAYERLVQYSLDRLSQGSQDQQTIYISILSKIAYAMLTDKRRTITSTDLIDSISTYAKESLLSINALKIIDQLVHSKILISTVENKYRFRYPYLYHYFCGKYIAKHITKQEIKDRIEYMSSKLHVIEYGSIMIFICHFLNNEEVLHDILVNALYILDGTPAFDFRKPYTLLNDVVTDISNMLDKTIIGSESDVSEARQRELVYQDNYQPHDASYADNSETFDEDSSDDMPIELGNMVSALRTIDVLGQILRNYPGDITRQNKIDAVDQIKELSMRIVGLMYSGLSSVKDDVIVELIRHMRSKSPGITESELNSKVRMMFNGLVFTLVCSMIHKASSTIATPLLIPVLETMASDAPNDLAITLMLYDTDMICQTAPRYDDIIKLHQRLKKDRCTYAQETLRLLVAQHLRRRHCGESTRNRLCSEFSFKKQSVLPPIPLPQ